MLTRKERLNQALKRVRLRFRGSKGGATPLFICGVQRSGTNMLLYSFNRHPLTECYYDNDDEAFEDYRLRDEETIRRLIARSRARAVVFKPIVDSQHARKILDRHEGARLIWIYRRPEDVVNSDMRRFPEARDLYRTLFEPETADWRSEELEPDAVETARRLWDRQLSDASSRAVCWWLRNRQLFRQRLDSSPAVRLVSYERLAGDPAGVLAGLCSHAGLEYDPAMARTIHPKSVRKNAPPDIDPEVMGLCEDLYARLAEADRQLVPSTQGG